MPKPKTPFRGNTAARAPVLHFRIPDPRGGRSTPIVMYGVSRFMHFWVDILIVLYIFGFGNARLGEWRLNHINGAEDNASCSDSSAEIDYRLY